MTETGPHLFAVAALHDENRIGPTDEFIRQGIIGIFARTGGGYFDPRMVRKELFCCRTTKPIASANE
ncbi:MAG: hypothetical protein ACXWI3_00880 [Croceibacterium sp.]